MWFELHLVCRQYIAGLSCRARSTCEIAGGLICADSFYLFLCWTDYKIKTKKTVVIISLVLVYRASLGLRDYRLTYFSVRAFVLFLSLSDRL